MIALADRQKVVHDRDLVSLWAALKRGGAARLHAVPAHAGRPAGAPRDDAPAAEEAGYGYGV